MHGFVRQKHLKGRIRSDLSNPDGFPATWRRWRTPEWLRFVKTLEGRVTQVPDRLARRSDGRRVGSFRKKQFKGGFTLGVPGLGFLVGSSRQNVFGRIYPD